MSAKISKVKDEARGEVYYVFITDLPDNLAPVRFLIWRCPHCGAEIKGWTLRQLDAAIRSHKKRHAGAR